MQSRRTRIADFLSLERSVVAVAGTMFLMGLGEELWKRYMPKYLEALGAPVVAIGLYGSARDLLDGLYQYPGGWIADRYGRRRALTIFVAVAGVGYGIYMLAPAWPAVFVGLVLVMAWSSMASPTMFAVVGDALPPNRRTMGFTVQSILRRVPIVVAPTLGGLLIVTYGIHDGVRIGLGSSILLAVLTLGLAAQVRIPLLVDPAPTNILNVWRVLPLTLRRLLASDILVRTCEGLVDVFLILYATNIIGISAVQYGALVGVQMAVAILVYLPAARISDRIGRKTLVIATFLAFSFFPAAVVLAQSFAGLVLAFVVGGLREIGEPARKALIVDLAAPHLRGRSVGLYYLIRSLAVAPAALAGAFLWRIDAAVPFGAATLVGLLGTVLFAITVEESHLGGRNGAVPASP